MLSMAPKVSGPVFHDAKIAALALHHGVRELGTADRDFGRFPRLRTRNPFQDGVRLDSLEPRRR
jgi:uncharacterized protein